MNLYLAGTSVSAPRTDNPIAGLLAGRCKLHSYYHSSLGGFEEGWLKLNIHNGVELFLDSGAYSALTQGVEIDIDKYIDFIKRHVDDISVYANLDVIAADPRTSAERTLRNQQYMEEQGLSPLPVFHAGEDEEYLSYYLDNYEYIGLGGVVKTPIGSSATSFRAWLDRVFRRHLCDVDGWPRVKVHGFGLTTLRDMLRYPWYSVDSTSWVMVSRVGSIYVPRFRSGRWVYDDSAWIVSVTTRQTGDPKHYANFSPRHRHLVSDYLRELGYAMGDSHFTWVSADYEPDKEAGERWADGKKKGVANAEGKRRLEVIDEYGVSNDYRCRDQVNILYFQALQDNWPVWPTRFAVDDGVPGLGI